MRSFEANCMWGAKGHHLFLNTIQPHGQADIGATHPRCLYLQHIVPFKYRDWLKGVYVVARNVFLLLLNGFARPCLAVA